MSPFWRGIVNKWKTRYATAEHIAAAVHQVSTYERAHLLLLYVLLPYMVSGCVGEWGAVCAVVVVLQYLLYMAGACAGG